MNFLPDHGFGFGDQPGAGLLCDFQHDLDCLGSILSPMNRDLMGLYFSDKLVQVFIQLLNGKGSYLVGLLAQDAKILA